MLKKINNKFESLEYNKKLIIVISTFLVMILFVLFTPKTNKKDDYDSTNLIKLFNKIDNNYILDVSINEENTFNYKISNVTEIYDDKYLIKNNKTYIKEGNSYKEYNESLNYGYDLFYDIRFIKSLLNKCNYEGINKSKVKCSIKVSDYVNMRNIKENLSYRITDSKYIDFIITFNDYIEEIDVDYSYLNKIINNKDDKLLYNIKILEINSNNFDDINISSYVESNENN